MKKLDAKKAYETLVAEYNSAVAHYNEGKKTGRWDGINPDDRDAHGQECGYIYGLEWAIDTLFPEMKDSK